MPPPNPTASLLGDNRLRAIGYMIMAMMLFGCLDATAKYLATRLAYPVPQVLWVRFVTQLAMILIFAPLFGVADRAILFKTTKPLPQAARSVLMLVTTGFNFLALRYLRLDQTVTITFLTPLVIAVLAGPLLGEWIGWRRIVAVLAGFAGVLIAVRPGFGVVPPAVIFSFLSMLSYALFMILTRWLAAYEPPTRTLFYSMFAGTILGAPVALLDWHAPTTPLEIVLLLATGVVGGLAHYLIVLANRLAPANTIAPFIYMQLISMVFFGYLVFADVPDIYTLLGAAVVIGSGVYLWSRERFLAIRRTVSR